MTVPPASTDAEPADPSAEPSADPSAVIAAPPKRELGRAGRIAAGVSEQGFGVDPEAEEGVPYAGLRLAGLILALVAIGYLNRWMLVVIMGIVVMISLHELGHYVMAKRAGMKVTEFFLGFGPKIWSVRRGETEYGIKVIPAGAYVKIPGMTNMDEIAPADEARTYRQKSFRQRVGVAVAGSTMHFLLAFVLIFVALVAVGQPAGTLDPTVAAKHWRIEEVTPGTGAEAAGLKPGDRIVSIDGKTIATFADLHGITQPRKGRTVPLTYERDGKVRSTTITLRPFYSWYLDQVVPGSGEARSKLELGDQILTINGTATTPSRDLDELLRSVHGKTVDVTYERTVKGEGHRGAAPVKVDKMILAGLQGYVGIGEDTAAVKRLNPVKGLVRTPVEFVNVMRLSVTSLGHFFTPGGISDFAGQVGRAQKDRAAATKPVKAVSTQSSSRVVASSGSGRPTGKNRLMSIYGLVRLGSDVGSIDPGALISLFALINIFIGVFNLVPLLPFDGGHVMIAVYEKVQERRLRRRRYFADVSRLLPMVYAVTLILLVLFVSTMYLDIANPLQTR